MEILCGRSDARRILQELIRQGVVCVDLERPHTFRSGLWSPIKLDFEKIEPGSQLFQDIANVLEERAPDYIRREYPVPTNQLVFVGVPNGGSWWADRLSTLLIAEYRHADKCVVGGVEKFVLGENRGKNRLYVVVEDVVTTGLSTQMLVDAILKEGRGNVARILVSLFCWGFRVVERSPSILRGAHATLFNWSQLREQIPEHFTPDILAEVDAWHANPLAWSNAVDQRLLAEHVHRA